MRHMDELRFFALSLLAVAACTPETVVIYETAGAAEGTGPGSDETSGGADASSEIPTADDTGCVGDGCSGSPPCNPAPPDPFLPYPAGTHMGITQGYGCARTHTGLNHFSYDFNVAADYELTHNLVASASSPGQVVEVVDWVTGSCFGQASCGAEYNYGWGNCVVIEVANSCGETFERYCHLDAGPGSVFVNVGDVVCSGTPLGYIGTTGNSSNSHLHWQREDQNGQTIPADFQEGVAIVGTCDICSTATNASGCYESGNYPPAGCDGMIPPPPTADPCEGLSSGDYCGSNDDLNGYRGNSSDLVTCSNGSIASIENCAFGCLEMPPGQHDVCADEPSPDCGNGGIDPGEDCDQGNLGGATCTSEGFDGGTVTCTPGCQLDLGSCCTDECVLGANTCGAAGQRTCQAGPNGCTEWSDPPVPCPAGCDGDVCYNPSCGNGNLDGGEACDGANLGGQSCASQGFDGGSLSCTGACTLNTSGCYACGDGSIDPGESCDSGNLGGQSCASQGFDGGGLSCTGSCNFNTSGCYECGDGTVNPGESCDGGNLGGQSCASMGFGGGSLSCTGSCNFNTAGCYSCGDGTVNPGESCDGGNLGGQSCASLGFGGGSLGCTGSCGFDTSGCCGAGDYWSPTSDASSDFWGQQHDQTIPVHIEVEVQQTGSQLEVQVCKPGDIFQENVALYVTDVGPGTANLEAAFVPTAGQTCATTWIDMQQDGSYSEGDTFNGSWQLVSPWDVRGHWNWPSTSCNVVGSPWGTCWNGSGINLTRTCL